MQSDDGRRRIGVLVTGPQELAANVRLRLGQLPVATSVGELEELLSRDARTLFDLVFVLLVRAVAPPYFDLGRLRDLAGVIAGIVVTQVGRAETLGESALIAAIREVCDFVLWAPEETLLDDLCDALR